MAVARVGAPSVAAPAGQEWVGDLDEALAHLSVAERDAILLRFYENMSYPEMGAAVGRGEDAARKRVSAALDKFAGGAGG